MAFPTSPLDAIRAGLITTAISGDVVAVVRHERIITGVALGAARASAAHVLLEGEGGVPWVYAMDAFGNQTRALHISAAGQLLLDITDSEADGSQLRDYVGCLGLTSEGLVLGAASGRDGWRGHIQTFVSLSTFALLEPRHELLVGAQWLTNWSVSYRTAMDEVVVVLRNPPWAEEVLVAR